MSQSDLSLANQSRTAFRAELNTHIGTLATVSSAATAPATTFPGQLWLDTSLSPAILRQRNTANTAWVGVLLDYALAGDMSAGTAGKVATAQRVKDYVTAVVATLDVATSIAGLAPGGIGSYIFGGFGGAALAFGATISGALLYPGGVWKGSGAGTSYSPAANNGEAWMNGEAVTLTGQWRCQGSNINSGWSMTSFLRVL